jgi:hypothetical protein
MGISGTNPTQHIAVATPGTWSIVQPFPADIPSNIVNRACHDAKRRLLERQATKDDNWHVELEVEGDGVALTQDLEGAHVIPPRARLKILLKQDSQVIDEAVFTWRQDGVAYLSPKRGAKPECPEHKTEMDFPTSINHGEESILRGRPVPNKFHYCQKCNWRYSSDLREYFEATELPACQPMVGPPLSKRR